jgi:predicted TIM-barrel fold metal-dependent hydrolase
MAAPRRAEPAIDPALPIIDPHHHLWFAPGAPGPAMAPAQGSSVAALARISQAYPKYLWDDLVEDFAGHDVRATVYVEAHAMYRQTGPEHLRSAGEVEFARGVAAMGASGAFGESRLCAAIIGAVDLSLGDRVCEVLEAHIAAGGGRYRGVRTPGVAYDSALDDLNQAMAGRPHVLLDTRFREGFRRLGELGLVYEVWALEPQLPDLIDLARAFPGTPIVLNHAGSPIGFGAHSNRLGARFPIWRRSICELAACPNVVVKLGGLGNPISGLRTTALGRPATSEELAADWRPYVETCIEVFGPRRCMFESNAPVDCVTAPYGVLWNAFKRLTAGASQDERAALFHATAANVYGIAS